MKQRHTKLNWIIAGTSGTAGVYLLSLVAGVDRSIILGLLVLTYVAVIYMAIRILKDPYSTTKTFRTQFYQDRDDLRRSEAE